MSCPLLPDAVLRTHGGSGFVRDHRVATCSSRRSWRLASLAPLAFSLDLVSSLWYKTFISLPLLYAAWRRHGTVVGAHRYRLAVSLSAAGVGAAPAGRASLCAHPARRGGAAA